LTIDTIAPICYKDTPSHSLERCTSSTKPFDI